MTRRLEVDLAVPGDAILAEGPVWDARHRLLRWVDVYGERILHADPATGRGGHVDVPGVAGSIALRAGGGLLVTIPAHVLVTESNEQEWEVLCTIERERDRPDNRMNDGACDPTGRFWCGSSSSAAREGDCALYRVDAGGRVTTMAEGVTISNGIAWSPDATRMYYIDSHRQSVDVFDFDVAAGEVRNRRTLVAVPPGEGLPDGMAVDLDGCLWVAMFFAGAVHRYTPSGVLDTVVQLPVPGVSSVAFGGTALDVLFVTTGRVRETAVTRARGIEIPGEQVGAGGVFACRPGVSGLPSALFQG